MIERPTTSGSNARIRRSTVAATRSWTRIRSAMPTVCPGPTLPASDASAPLGIRIVRAGVCSNESGMENRRTRIPHLTTPAGRVFLEDRYYDTGAEREAVGLPRRVALSARCEEREIRTVEQVATEG